MSERLNKVHLIICTIAATVVAIGFIVIHVYDETHGLLLMAMWVSIAIVLFYFIGHMARAFLISRVFVETDEGTGENDEDPVLVTDPEEEIIISSHDDETGMLEVPGMDLNNGIDEDEFMMEEAKTEL